MKKVITEDGSTTYFSEEYSENFHSTSGARREALKKFAEPALHQTGLLDKINLSILDIGFGLGYNSAEAIRLCAKAPQPLSLHIYAIEKEASLLPYAVNLQKEDNLPAIKEVFQQLTKKNSSFFSFDDKKIELNLNISDARTYIKQIPIAKKFDAIFLDAFSTKKNPELWSYDLFKKLFQHMHKDSVLVTYSSAYPVISGFIKIGAYVYQTTPEGRSSGGLAVFKTVQDNFSPLDAVKEKERNNTTGILPYRDPNLCSDTTAIINRYQKERQQLILQGVMSIKKYRKKSN